MIFFNGRSGGLGRYFEEAAQAGESEVIPLASRIEDLEGFRGELAANPAPEPTYVLMAAKVSVPWCEANADAAYRTNVTNTVASVKSFVEANRSSVTRPKVLYVSSAHLYARNDGVIHETDPVSPRSVYARTKLEAERALAALSERESFDLRIARVFGLVAPVQPENYVLHALLKRAREKRLTGIPGLSNVRDYLDSRDVCAAILRAVTADEEAYARVCPDRVLNVASGEGVSIRTIAELCVRAVHPPTEAGGLLSELSEAPPRADDVPRIVGSIARYRALFGENPKRIPLEKTIQDALRPT